MRYPVRDKFFFLATTALAACAASGGLAQSTGDQMALDARSAGLEEIVVTAQKREADLQKTPISMSVLGTQDLTNRRVQSLADLGDGAIPSLRVAPFFSRNSALAVGIRGIVPTDANQPSRDAGVGIYLDGVYLGRSQGLAAALYDIERIEVLKGPQGTLFGRNSTGGAVSIISRKPSGDLHLTQTAGVRNFGGYSMETHLDLPRMSDVSIKVDGIVTKRNGTVDNPMQGEHDFNSYDRHGLHVRALWEPSASFSADYGFDISRDASTPYYLQLLKLNPGAAPLAPAVQIQGSRARVADIGVPEAESAGDTWGHLLTLTWTPAADIEVKSISSYRDLAQSQFDNGGGHSARFTPNATFSRYSLAGTNQHQYSEELQIVGSLPGLTYVAGLYYYHEQGFDWAWTPNTLRWNADGTGYARLGSLGEGAQTPFPDRQSTAFATSIAAYGQATWTPPILNDGLHLTAGVRYTRDRKHGTLEKSQGIDVGNQFRFRSGRTDPAVTLAYDVTDEINLYAKWGTAHRAGGANSRSLIYRSFGPEKVETYEVGAKSELFDRRARLNLAAYDTRYKDMQVDFSAQSFLAGRNIGTLETVNTPGTVRIKGFEAEAALALTDELTLSTSYAYTQYHAPAAPNPFLNNTPQAIYIVYTPRNAISGSLDYRRPVAWGTVIAHLDVNAAGGHHALSTEAATTQPSKIVNARLSLADIPISGATTLQLSLWSRNLLNEDHTFVVTTSASVGGLTGIFNEPRTYGFDATLKF